MTRRCLVPHAKGLQQVGEGSKLRRVSAPLLADFRDAKRTGSGQTRVIINVELKENQVLKDRLCGGKIEPSASGEWNRQPLHNG